MDKILKYLEDAFGVETMTKLILVIFVTVPILTSFISTYHTYHLFVLGNAAFLAFMIAFTYELINLAALGMVVLHKDEINNTYIWGVFIFMTIIQIIGNVYYGYDYTARQITMDDSYIQNLIDFVSTIVVFSPKAYIMVLALFIGVPIPLLSAIMVHMSAGYLKNVINKKEADKNAAQAKTDEDVASLTNELDELKLKLKVYEPDPPTYDELEAENVKLAEFVKNKDSDVERLNSIKNAKSVELEKLKLEIESLNETNGDLKLEIGELLQSVANMNPVIDEEQLAEQFDSRITEMVSKFEELSLKSNKSTQELISEYLKTIEPVMRMKL